MESRLELQHKKGEKRKKIIESAIEIEGLINDIDALVCLLECGLKQSLENKPCISEMNYQMKLIRNKIKAITDLF